jgi:hypothetical protein
LKPIYSTRSSSQTAINNNQPTPQSPSRRSTASSPSPVTSSSYTQNQSINRNGANSHPPQSNNKPDVVNSHPDSVSMSSFSSNAAASLSATMVSSRSHVHSNTAGPSYPYHQKSSSASSSSSSRSLASPSKPRHPVHEQGYSESVAGISPAPSSSFPNNSTRHQSMLPPPAPAPPILSTQQHTPVKHGPSSLSNSGVSPLKARDCYDGFALNTNRLKPLQQRTKHGTVAILASGKVVVDFLSERNVMLLDPFSKTVL